MTGGEVLQMARELNQRGEAHALVTVVRAVAPTSAYVGAQAIVLADGTLRGWIGGGCTQDVVIEAARTAIKTGRPKLIRIANDRLSSDDAQDLEQHPLPCASNGSVELFIHPYRLGAALCVLGSTPAADEARFFADHLGIRLVDAPALASVVLVATQGQGDETALESALRSPAAHVLMIASRRKAQRMRELMQSRGVGESRIARLQAPAGQDVGAQTPAEIALVAVAAVLGLLRGADLNAAPSVRFVNPVCGTEVDTASAKHVELFEGTSYYFCCDGCWESFRVDPVKYASVHHQTRRPQ